jgi:hypothetical protein
MTSTHIPELYNHIKQYNYLLFGATAPFGHIPVNVLFGCLDSTAFTVQAVLSVDLQFRGIGLLILHEFIDFGWAEALLGPRESV